MFGWYGYCFRNYFVLEGRASRAQFWVFTIMSFVVPFLLCVIYGVLVELAGGPYSLDYANPMVLAADPFGLIGVEDAIFTIFGLISFLPGIAVTVRRLHDRNHSGWWVFWSFIIPPLGFIVLIFMLLGSLPEPNQYGIRAPVNPQDRVPTFYQHQAEMFNYMANMPNQMNQGGQPPIYPGQPPVYPNTPQNLYPGQQPQYPQGSYPQQTGFNNEPQGTSNPYGTPQNVQNPQNQHPQGFNQNPGQSQFPTNQFPTQQDSSFNSGSFGQTKPQQSFPTFSPKQPEDDKDNNNH